jgi:peptide/nickel transport system substrate-binding protein
MAAVAVPIFGALPAFGEGAGTPRRGGKLRVATDSQSTNDTFDSTRYRYINDYIRGRSFYSTLTLLNEKGEPVPEIAESWETDQAGAKWIFKLRKGVVFHDGSPLTMADVVYSIMRHKNKANASSALPLMANIDSVTADGPSTVAVQLTSPDADLPALLSVFQFTIVKDGTLDFASPNGTGAFKIKKFQPGVLTSGVRNDSFWKDGRPYVDEFELINIVDSTARVNALLAGDVHIISEVRGAGVDAVQASSDAQLFITPAPRYGFVRAAVDMAPTSNEDLRLALAYLVDRERFLSTVLKGRGAIANDHPFVPESPFYNANIPQRQIDLDKAKYHIQRSGIGSNPVELHVSDAVSNGVELGVLIQRGAESVGLNLQLRREPADSYWNVIAGKRSLFLDTNFPRPTYNILLSLFWKSDAPWNHSHLKIPELDHLIESARSTLDLEGRKQIYWRVQELINGSGATLIPSFAYFVDGHSKALHGLSPVPVGNLAGLGFADQVWLDI